MNMTSPFSLPSLSSELRDMIVTRNILTTRTRMKVLSDLDALQQETKCKKEESLRFQAIQEILSSEVNYLGQLEIIMKYFMKPISEKKLLCPASYTTLFENIETLYNVNGELLVELRKNTDNIATAFCKLAPFFKLYSVYAYNYKRALDVLQEIQHHDQKTREFIANQETRPEVGNKLSSLLIAPIQRVPRYKLLLQEVIKHTAPKDSDYNMLQASLVDIENVAKHINTLVAEYEETQELLELQKRIVGPINLVKPGRRLIHQGPLMRVSRKGNSSYRRHFVLLSDTLLYCKGDPESSLTVCCLLPLNKCKVEPVLSNGLFKVVCLKETLLLYSTTKDSEIWIQTLEDAVKKYIECRQTLRKDSSSRIPMRNIIRFPSENRFEKRRNRKRKCIPEETEVTDVADDSTVVYINRDKEPEEKQARFFPLTSKLKRTSPPPNLENITPVDENKKPNCTKQGEKSSQKHDRFVCNILRANIEEDVYAEKSETGNGERVFFHNVGKFFSHVGTSFKDLFKRN